MQNTSIFVLLKWKQGRSLAHSTTLNTLPTQTHSQLVCPPECWSDPKHKSKQCITEVDNSTDELIRFRFIVWLVLPCVLSSFAHWKSECTSWHLFCRLDCFCFYHSHIDVQYLPSHIFFNSDFMPIDTEFSPKLWCHSMHSNFCGMLNVIYYWTNSSSWSSNQLCRYPVDVFCHMHLWSRITTVCTDYQQTQKGLIRIKMQLCSLVPSLSAVHSSIFPSCFC